MHVREAQQQVRTIHLVVGGFFIVPRTQLVLLLSGRPGARLRPRLEGTARVSPADHEVW